MSDAVAGRPEEGNIVQLQGHSCAQGIYFALRLRIQRSGAQSLDSNMFIFEACSILLITTLKLAALGLAFKWLARY